MVQTQNTVETLNDLVKINNDRIEGYKRAADETKDADTDLKNIFNDMINQSMQFRQQLTRLVAQSGDEPEKGTRTDGKIYRAWMDVKAAFSGSSRKSILENCEFGEDAALKAYTSALSPDNELPSDVESVLTHQHLAIKAAHDKIKALRDHAK